MIGESLRKWMLTAMTFIAASLMLSSCIREQPVPKRSFTTLDLLIGLSDMPPGWIVGYGPGKGRSYISPKEDSSEISFYVNDEHLQPGRRGAAHEVYRYRSSEAARGVYKDLVLPRAGKTPEGWSYQSPIADQSDFTCYDYEGREPYPFCEWSARYEEYVVIFSSWLIPGYMSLEDIERVVRVIDARMAAYLGKTAPSTPTIP